MVTKPKNPKTEEQYTDTNKYPHSPVWLEKLGPEDTEVIKRNPVTGEETKVPKLGYNTLVQRYLEEGKEDLIYGNGTGKKIPVTKYTREQLVGPDFNV